MTKENIGWLNDNVLMGFVGDREKWAGNSYAKTGGDGMRPWFAREGYGGGYVGSVPVEALRDKLFNWRAVEAPLIAIVNGEQVSVDGRKAIVRSDTLETFNIFKEGYTVHQYDEWLVKNVETILDDELCIDSAGLLLGGAVAWVSISLPETVVVADSFAIRPRLLAFTSHSGKFATTYMRSVNAPLCDNSLSAEISGGNGERFKMKHSANSFGRINNARDALGIIYRDTEEMVDFFTKLAEWEVSDKEFSGVVDSLCPVPEAIVVDGKVKNQRAITMASKRRDGVSGLYRNDYRAAPWAGSGLGVLQAFNTWDQHGREMRGNSVRQERQMLATLGGDVDAFDGGIIGALKIKTEFGRREVLEVV